MASSPYQTVSLSQAAAMYSGKLIVDFCMTRVGSGWGLLLFVGNSDIAVLRADEPNADEPGKIFDNADAALLAAYQIGFDVRSVGLFRQGVDSKDRLLNQTMDTLRSVAGRTGDLQT